MSFSPRIPFANICVWVCVCVNSIAYFNHKKGFKTRFHCSNQQNLKGFDL